MRTRIPFNSTLLRLRSETIAAITKELFSRSFVQTHPPIITSSDCEGAGEVFNVGSPSNKPAQEGDDGTFFRSPKYLTVSSQLHLEALAQSVGKVWTLSPTFRAEKSDTSRHLCEFYMLEAEIDFANDMEEIMDLVQIVIQAATSVLADTNSRIRQEMLQGAIGEKELVRRWDGMGQKFRRITYTEAIKVLQSSTHQFDHEPKWGAGLQAEHERYIASTLGGYNGSIVPVFVTHYPKGIKPFYMLPSSFANDGHGETVDCFDLLVPEACEIAGGSMREHRLEPLVQSMQNRGLIPPTPVSSDQELGDLKWYVDLRRWGSVPHGGFGMGFDRLLGYLAGVQNIKEVVTFPRWVGRCDC